MSTLPLLVSDALGRHQGYFLNLFFAISAAKTIAFIGSDVPQATFGFDAPGSATAALGQTTIDNLLGSVNEVLAATAFGSTALGTDAFGFVLACEGQIKEVKSIRVLSNIGTGGADVNASAAGQTTALPNTLPAFARVQKTSGGNIAGQVVLTGLDAATAGLVQIQLFVDIV